MICVSDMKRAAILVQISLFLKLRYSWLDVKIAFLMGRHQRLGAESCVRFLPRDMLQLILDLVKGHLVVFGGLVNKPGVERPISRDVFEFQPFFNDPESSRLCFLVGKNSCSLLPPMPVGLSFCFGAFDGTGIFVFGGAERVATGHPLTAADGPWEGRPNLHLFHLCLKTRLWSQIPDILQKPCIRGTSVVFGKKLICLGGYHGNGLSTPDRAFDVSSKPVRIHFPQRAKQSDCWYANSSCVVLGSFLIACCGYKTRHAVGKCRVDVLDLSDNFANWVSIPELTMDLEVSCYGFGSFDGKIFLIGGMKGLSYRCAVDSVWSADLKDQTPCWKKEVASLPIPLFDCAVVSAIEGLYCVGGSTGHECYGFERSNIVYFFNGSSWKTFSQLTERIESCGAVQVGAVL